MAQNTETERKFLVRSDAFKSQSVRSFEIRQGYLSKDPERTVRIRVRDAQAFLTIKSCALREGISRYEWEHEIDIADARELLQICLPGVIEKTRYVIPALTLDKPSINPRQKSDKSPNTKERVWEVDVFHGRLEGLVLAEIELDDENELFDLPEWLGEEVTDRPEYYNANM